MKYDIEKLPSPCYLIDTGLLENNLKTLDYVQKQTGAKTLLALKAFACWSVFGIVKKYLHGTAASSLFEAKLAKEYFGKDIHLCAPAYRDDQFPELLELSDHIVFNSFTQWQKFRLMMQSKKDIKAGLRVNPEHSEVKQDIYDPCAEGSRLGIKAKFFEGKNLEGITGLHFHTLCELNADALQRTLQALENKFSDSIPQMKWINFGGGHHITRPDYDLHLLCDLIKDFKQKYNVDIYLEPGEAVALNAGFLIATVLDIVKNDIDIAILDTSAAAHMPDVLEMPYRPMVNGSDLPGKKSYNCRLAGPTCLAGDVIGDYSFDKPLRPGDRVIFHDMAHYTIVKNNMFNGINLPDIVLYYPETDIYKTQRHFNYTDFKTRLS